MTKFIGALLMVLSLSLFGSSAVSALDASPTIAAAQDGDGKHKKKHSKKKHQKGKKKSQWRGCGFGKLLVNTLAFVLCLGLAGFKKIMNNKLLVPVLMA